MITQYSIELIQETEKLKMEKEALRQQLLEARETIETLKSENIDAVVLARENDLRIFIEKAAEKPYRILIEKMNEGAVTLNEDGTILYCNSSFANMVRLPLQKILGTVFQQYMDDSLKENFEDWLTHKKGKTFKEEGTIKGHVDNKLVVLMTANTLWLDTIFVINIVLTDLTIQNEHLERLKRKSKLIEEKNEELENVNLELAFQIEEKERQAAELAIANIELALAEELVIAYQELAIETHERKKREAELNIAQKDVKELEGLNTHRENVLNTISHDLRSPLAGIIQITDLLKNNYDTMNEQELHKMLDLLFHLSTEELGMLDYLVDWARIKYAAEAFSPEYMELAKYVEKVFDTLKEIATGNKIHLYNEIEKNTMVYADKKMLLSIIQNIVSNSIKYTNAGGKITVSAKRKDDKVVVEIKDTGVGMSRSVREKLFAPHLKALSSARKENKGAGIGLLLTKCFVDKNGGQIWIESTEGEGTSFFFTLRVEKPMEQMV